EAAGLHHARERLHRVETVHAGVRYGDCRDSTNSVPRIVVFIGVAALPRVASHTGHPPNRRSTMQQRDTVFPAGRHALYEQHRYSAAVRSNGFLFVSGQVGSRNDGTPEPEFEAQVRRAFANLEATLRPAGAGFDD